MSLSHLLSLPKELHTHTVALPLYLEGGEDAVLVLHGYTGITDELSFFAHRLYTAGFTVALPRLPGHGTDGLDFITTRAEDWYRKALDTYLDLRGRFRTVHWVGLSMGALLAILGNAQFQSGKLVLAAPALQVFDPRLFLTPLLRFFLHRIEKNEYRFDGPKEYGTIAETYWKYNWPIQAAELYRLQRYAQRHLSLLTGEILVLLGGKDDTVPSSVLDLVKQKAHRCEVDSITFSESGHVVLNDVEREQVADAVITWLSHQYD
ncbi:MAG: alpha/beta fold hydrolase [Spirochaetes bacterium]|nr:alpha/beta fold hydrolase [Spirochaetota bacterium]